MWREILKAESKALGGSYLIKGIKEELGVKYHVEALSLLALSLANWGRTCTPQVGYFSLKSWLITVSILNYYVNT